MEEVLIAPLHVSFLLATSAVDVPPTVRVEDCPAAVQPLPASLSGWARPTPVRAGADAASAATLTIGESVRATLEPITKIAFAAEPEKAGVAGSYGGVFVVVVPAKARYRVALGSPGWIDVLTGAHRLLRQPTVTAQPAAVFVRWSTSTSRQAGM